jgi:hypothetical protein
LVFDTARAYIAAAAFGPEAIGVDAVRVDNDSCAIDSALDQVATLNLGHYENQVSGAQVDPLKLLQ